MTVMAERTSQMQVEEFEEIASKAPETVMLEFIDDGASPGAARGRIAVKSMPDGDHATITMWLLRQCIQARPDLDLHPEQGCASAHIARVGLVPMVPWPLSPTSPDRGSGRIRKAS